MATETLQGRPTLSAKIMQTSPIAGVLADAAILYILIPAIEFTPLYAAGDARSIRITAILGTVSVLAVMLGFSAPRRIVRWYGVWRWYVKDRESPATLILFRGAAFGTVGILGIIAGIFGAAWYVTLLFLIAAAGSLLLTFPTGKNWRSLKEKQSPRY